MAKYLFEARYTPEGAKGVAKEGGSGRRAAVAKMAEGLGGKLETFYYAFGDVDAYVIVEMPDNVTAAAAALAVNQGGAHALPALRIAMANRENLPMVLAVAGSIGDPALKPDLERFVNDSDPRVASAARDALRFIGGQRDGGPAPGR